ncbi:DUF721 domain-containing protein [Acetobacter orientalis]|uniref:DUF721 domain-containing protein n=1 Tax=Acetobacter orientalis TaxID=146474 RepID=UPI0039E98A01
MAKDTRSGKVGARTGSTAPSARTTPPGTKAAPKTTRGKTGATPPPESPKRALTARSLAALLPAVTAPAFRRRSPASVQVFTDWADIVGPAHAAVTTPSKLSAGTLTIACAGPVAMELQHLSDALVARINTWCGHGLVARLRFVQDPQAGIRLAAPKRLAPSLRPNPQCTVPDMEESPLRAALEALGARILQEKQKR